jgi:hypothetical protein
MSSSVKSATTTFMNGTQVPLRVPILMSLSWR